MAYLNKKMEEEFKLFDESKGDTWPKVLKFNYENYGENLKAMRQKKYGIWQAISWKDYFLNVKYFGLGLLSIGFEKGDKLLIIGENSPELYYGELAAQCIHGISVVLHPDLTPDEIRYMAENSEARFVYVQDQEQVDKLFQIKSQLPLLKKIIFWNYKGLSSYKDPILIGLKSIMNLGKEYEKAYPEVFEKYIDSGNAEDICTIVYTSGTTGDFPKAVLHSFKTLRINTEFYMSIDPWNKSDNLIPFSPPASIMDKWFLIGAHLLSGCTINFAESSETYERDVREIRPNIIFHSARAWESRAVMTQARILVGDKLKKFVYDKFISIGYKMAEFRYKRRSSDPLLKLIYLIANLLLFKPIKNKLGLSNARVCYSIGATLSTDVFNFYHALGLPLKSIYSTTEGGVLTCPKNNDIDPQTVGTSFNKTEIMIMDDGEIVYRQPGICVGYYKNIGDNRNIKDGWFYSGDIGFIREDGHLVILGRKSEVIKLINGDLLTPQSIESKLRFSPYIKDAWLFSNKEGIYVSVLIIINFNNVSKWAGQKGISYTTFVELSQNKEVYELIKGYIENINRHLAHGLKIKKFVNLPKEFDPDQGELTRTGNIRRRVLEERYKNLIEAIYNGKEEFPLEVHETQKDGRVRVINVNLIIKSL